MLKQTAALAATGLMAIGLAPVTASAAVVAPVTAARPSSLSPRATVTEFATASGKSVRTFRVGRDPEGMVMAPDGKFVYVANAESDSISVLPATGTTAAARWIHLHGSPDLLVLSPNGKMLYASYAGKLGRLPYEANYVLAIRTRDMRIVGSVEFDSLIQQLAIAPDAKIVYATTSGLRGAQLLVPIRTATNRAGRPITVASSKYDTSAVAVTPNGHFIYVTSMDWPRNAAPKSGLVTAIRASTGAVLKRIRTAPLPWFLAVTPNSRTVYVSTEAGVTPLASVTNRAGKSVATTEGPGPMVITPDGRTLYFSTASGVLPVSIPSNRAGTPIQLASNYFPNPSQGAIATSPDGRTVYVAALGFYGLPGAVVPIRTTTSSPAAPIPAGLDPQQIVISPNGKLGFVADQGDS